MEDGRTAINKSYVLLRGLVLICSLVFKRRSVTSERFGIVGQISVPPSFALQACNVT